MRVDFYQLGPNGHGSVIGSIASKVLADEQRLLVVADDEPLLARLDRMLWDEGSTSFLPHGIAGGPDDPRQPILLSATTDAPNLARNILIADGEWRDAALHFDRAFYLFDEATLTGARLAWKLLAGRDEVERNYWASEDGKWVKKA
ncbi:MAG: DNA polymerase III subunit chi [Sphingomicrobium sp.]